jgi:hypothetical protein
MDFCYIWLRRLIGENLAFKTVSTRNQQELTGNDTMHRGLAHFTEGLAAINEDEQTQPTLFSQEADYAAVSI